MTAWYIGLTAFTLLIAYRGRGLRRPDGLVIIGAYAVFDPLGAGHGAGDVDGPSTDDRTGACRCSRDVVSAGVDPWQSGAVS